MQCKFAVSKQKACLRFRRQPPEGLAIPESLKNASSSSSIQYFPCQTAIFNAAVLQIGKEESIEITFVF